MPCSIDMVGSVHIVYSAQTNASEDYCFLCEFTNAQVLQQAMVLFEDLPR